MQFAAAAAALREAAHLPSRSASRTERLLASAAAGLGPEATARLWAEGSRLEASPAIELAQAMTLATAPGGDAATGSALPGTLTPREHQIAGLVARGRSNRAIAQELLISPATVARHVANILVKLGFNSRVQVAAWAAHQDGDRPGPSAG